MVKDIFNDYTNTVFTIVCVSDIENYFFGHIFNMGMLIITYRELCTIKFNLHHIYGEFILSIYHANIYYDSYGIPWKN